MVFSVTRAPLAVEFDSRPFKARIGLVVLATDHASEPELSQLLNGREIAIYASRVPYRNPVTTRSLQAMAPELTEAAARILPDEELDVLVFGCTAGTVAIGEPMVEHSITLAFHPGGYSGECRDSRADCARGTSHFRVDGM